MAPDEVFHSPLRSTWLTTLIGLALLAVMTVVAVTGFLSHAAYDPDLGFNAIIPRGQDFQPFVFDWPTRPVHLYAVTQGLHVTLGIAAVPLLLAKLWSVMPRLYELPAVRSPAHALERLATLALVGSAFFQMATGICNVQLYYPFHFNFVVAHYYGAWIFVSALALHVAVRVPAMRTAYATRRAVFAQQGMLAAHDPEEPTISRRGLLGLVGAATAGLLVTTAGQSIGGPLRRLAVLAPRGGVTGFPVNKTAATARVTRAMTGAAYRLELRGPRGTRRFTRPELEALPQHTHHLPIACVEGWSTTQRWTGVRLADLAAAAGARPGDVLHVGSLQPRGAFRQTTLSHDQVHDDRSLLALRVNGEDLPLDHGYPARIIVPALPGVHNTKWVSHLTFAAT